MSYTVYLGDSGRPFPVEAGQSLLAAGLAAGVPLPYGCSAGTCAACRCRVRSGEVRHRRAPAALSQAEQDAGYALLCQAEAASDIVLDWRAPADARATPPSVWPCRLLERRWLADEVLGVRLKLPRGEQAFEYLPGQYVDFLLDNGERRSFSLATAPDGESIELHVKVTPDGRFSRYLAEELPERSMLRFEGPLGAFYLHERDRPLVMVAGGTGFAPIKAIIEDALVTTPERAIHLVWGVRQAADLYLQEQVQAWSERYPGFRYTPVCSDAGPEWSGARGLVHEVLAQLHPDLSAHALYISGPPAMVRAARETGLARGVDPDHLHYDSFDDAHITWPELASPR